MRGISALFVVFAGCGVGWPAGAPVRAEGGPAWRDEVAAGLAVWSDALPGCPLFDLGETGRPIRLVPIESWPHGDTVGLTTDEGIDVRQMTPAGRHRVLVHELGHAIGLEHGAGGVMAEIPVLAVPMPSEVRDARDALGC